MNDRMIKFTAFFLLAVSLCAPVSFAKGGKESKKKLDAMNESVKKFSEAGDLQKAIEAAENAMEFCVKEFGANSLEAGHAMNNTANLYLYGGSPVNAERLYKEAILILTNRKDKEGLEAADYYYNLGMAYAMQEKYDEASKMLNQCLQIRTKKLGQENPETQKVQETLGEIWQQQKQIL